MAGRDVLFELDAGERDDESEALWGLFDALNIACGGHAGDATSMARVLGFCARTGVRAGAHPSYPDREGFGRRSLALPVREIAAAVEAQCAQLASIARAAGVAIGHLKPHGALYHDAATRPELATAVVRAAIAALGPDIAVIGPPRGALADITRTYGLRYLREGFADRATRTDGTLVPRDQPGALIVLPAAAAAQARAQVRLVDALCVHGDTVGALAIATAVRVEIRPRWMELGDRAIRIVRPPGIPASALVAAIRAWPGVTDAVVAPRDVAAYFDRAPVIDPAWIAALATLEGSREQARDVELRARYDGPDLGVVSRRTGLTVDEVIARHADATYVVETLGFAPGFAYLTGLDPVLHLARREAPRPRVPAGSIAIAGGYTAVYPFDSPGGWHLIGTVEGEPMFGPRGARLALGDRVRFVR